MRYTRDKSGVLRKYVDYWLAKEKRFRFISKYQIGLLLVWRAEHETDKDGMAIGGKASKLSNKIRDIYGFDFMITIAKDIWQSLSKKSRAQLIWHELNHLRIELDDEGYPVRDNEERIKLWLVQHDLVVRSFKEEIEKFGLSPLELESGEFLAKAYRRYLREHR